MSLPSLLETFADFRRRLPHQARLYVGGCSGEPAGLAEVLQAEPHLASGLTLLGAWVPGINRIDWASLAPDVRAETIFLSPDLRRSCEAGRTAILPLAYTQAWSWLQATPLDGGVLVVSPPDSDGRVSLGVSPDFGPAIAARPDVPLLGLVNPNMPAPPHSVRLPVTRFAALAQDDTPLTEIAEAALPPAFAGIAAQAAGLLAPGDTLQFGLGNVQQAVLAALGGQRGFAIHSGMISAPVLGLLDADPDLAITTGVAVGTPDVYARLARDPRIRFRPVCETHGLAALAAIPRFTAINSVIEVDLFGQANAEFIRGRQVSGTGGLVDFLRGAAASPGGRAITALASTAQGGQVSRITARLGPGAVSVARADMDIVVTEHGIAHLGGKSLDARAEALIAIADPAHRGPLAASWDEMRQQM